MITQKCTVVTVHTNVQELYLICSTNLLPMNAHSNKLDLPRKAGRSTTQYIVNLHNMVIKNLHSLRTTYTLFEFSWKWNW